MRAWLYASRTGNHWKWHLTVDPEMDRWHRYVEQGDALRLVWLAPSLSIGQAAWLRDRLKPKLAFWFTPLKARKEIVRLLRRLGVDPALVSAIRLTEETGEAIAAGLLAAAAREAVLPQPAAGEDGCGDGGAVAKQGRGDGDREPPAGAVPHGGWVYRDRGGYLEAGTMVIEPLSPSLEKLRVGAPRRLSGQDRAEKFQSTETITARPGDGRQSRTQAGSLADERKRQTDVDGLTDKRKRTDMDGLTDKRKRTDMDGLTDKRKRTDVDGQTDRVGQTDKGGQTRAAGNRLRGGQARETGNSVARAIAERELASHERGARALGQLLQGRSLLKDEVDSLLGHHPNSARLVGGWTTALQFAVLHGLVEVGGGVAREDRRFRWLGGTRYRCRRCGSGADRLRWADCPDCGVPCAYCEECLSMGRSRFCSPLLQGASIGAGIWHKDTEKGPAPMGYGRSGPINPEADRIVPAPGGPDTDKRVAAWKLSAAQAAASLAALDFLEKPIEGEAVGSRPSFLLWAVTGAGKTEMLFPLIDDELNRGGRVLIATPRRDVVLELEPRLKRAFPHKRVATLYGGSAERWDRGEITLATTHQLIRFCGNFTLAIIDELDAFPYHDNPMLQYAALKACSPYGRRLLLSATPPAGLRRAASRGKLPHAMVPVRFHRRPLPVPALLRVEPLAQWMRKGIVPAAVVLAMRASLEREAQLFVFVPRIALIGHLVGLLRSAFPEAAVEGTSSKDEARADKVTQFRDASIDILVTTTILERGVTVPRTDVFVLDADAALFDEASLVQMAGRAGRSKDDPFGRVIFAADETTAAQKEALRQIKEMNRLAEERGYILGS